MDRAEELVNPENILAHELQAALQEVCLVEQITSVNAVSNQENLEMDNKEIAEACKETEVNSCDTPLAVKDEKVLDSFPNPGEAFGEDVPALSEVRTETKLLNQQTDSDDACYNTTKNELSVDFALHECNQPPTTSVCNSVGNESESYVEKSEEAKEEASVGTLASKDGSGEYMKLGNNIDVLHKHLAKEREELDALHIENQVLKTEIEDLKMSLNEVKQMKQSNLAIHHGNEVENALYEDEVQNKLESERVNETVVREEKASSLPSDENASCNEVISEYLETENDAFLKDTEKKEDHLEYCQCDKAEYHNKEQAFENEETKDYPIDIPNEIDELKASAEEITIESMEERTKGSEDVKRDCVVGNIYVCQEPAEVELISSSLHVEVIDSAQAPSQQSAVPSSEVLEEIVQVECGTNARDGVEVMSPKTSDKVKHSKQKPEQETTTEEGTKDAQRPRSRSYPFKVYVSGLPLGARREDVLYYFSQFGEVLKMWDEGRHRANVLFGDEESYKKAVFAPDPYFDDHKLLIRSLNETIAVISGIPRCTPVKDAEKAVKAMLEEAGVTPCRITLPLSDPNNSAELNVLQGHAFVAFSDPQTLEKAEDRQIIEPFIIAGSPVKLHSSPNQFYEQFCVRAFPLPSEQPRSIVYHNVHATFAHLGEIVALSCQYIGNATAFAAYVLFETEDAVKKARGIQDLKILGQYVEVQEYFPFEQGQGFRHLWLKILNLPPRATITEVKHHFGHDRGILNVELDLDFGSCFVQVDSEAAMQRCLRMHQTYLRGKCVAILIAEENPDRAHFRDVARRGRRGPHFRNNAGRKKSVAGNTNTGFNGKTFTSATQPQGNQDRRGFERGDRKFSKSRSNASSQSKESSKAVKDDGDGVKIAEAHVFLRTTRNSNANKLYFQLQSKRKKSPCS